MESAKPSIDSIFLAAIERRPDQRPAYLEEACGQDQQLRARVERLLSAQSQVASFLEAPAPELGATIDGPPTEHPGAVIGPYKLLQQIGEGGMGVVFMAEQTEPIARRVALKIIKPGMDSRQVIARFEAERQALALMDHGNIARVLDAGTTVMGRPYFVMELVHGVPITTYCDDNFLATRQRLELFVPVCQAIQHAHQKGIIHRDIKPSNVMITLYDGEPVPKVIDFGVAKATEQKLSDRTLFTQYGTMVGTLEYMSPEQAGISALGVDTRSDVYSLGVLLYELLTGSTPLGSKRAKESAYDEILRMIKEDEPPKPSTRLSDSGDALVAISARRHTEPAKLAKLLRGELDWIVMKALEKDRSRRYQSASGIGDDVQRYLKDEPVLACPPSAWYRLSKFFRRHRGPVLAGMLLLLALTGGIVGTTWGLVHTSLARAAALRESREKSMALAAKETALLAARRSKRLADAQLFESYLAQAHAVRLSGRPGHRFKTLEVLKRANHLARELRLPRSKLDELRNAVIATLTLPDLYPTDARQPWPADGFECAFDESLRIYARTDQLGNCSVRRLADDAELYHLAGLGARSIPQFSRDGQFLAVIHLSKRHMPGMSGVELHVWSLAAAGARQILREPKARCVDFHADGHQLTASYNDGSIRTFDLLSGQPLGLPLAPHTLTREIAVARHPTEPLVAVSSYFKPVVQLRDLNTGEVIATLPQDVGATNVAWHPDGHTLAIGYGDSKIIKLYDRTTLEPFRELVAENKGNYLTFNHVGDRLATASWSGRMELFDVGTGKQLFSAGGGARRFSADDRQLAGGIYEGKLCTWQVGDGREFRTLIRQAVPEGYFLAVALHPNGRLLAAGMDDGLGLWDLAMGSELAFVPLDPINRQGVRMLHFEPSGALLSASGSGLHRWPVLNDADKPEHISFGPPERLLPRAHTFGYSDDCRVLAAANRAVGKSQPEAGGWIFHADQPGKPIRMDAGADIMNIAVSPDGKWVVTSTFATGIAKVWKAEDGQFVKQISDWGVDALRSSRDGRWLATSLYQGKVFAVGSWEPTESAGSLDFSPSAGQLVAMDPVAGVTPLGDRTTGRVVARLESPDATATILHILSPDGSQLIDVGNSKVRGIHVWDLRRIRRQLEEMEMEGDWPATPSVPMTGDAIRPIQVTVLMGDSEEASKPTAADRSAGVKTLTEGEKQQNK